MSDPVPLEKPKYQTGDIVRISKSRNVFTKEAYDMFSEEVYTVHRICPGPPIFYRLADLTGEPIDGRFYSQEITKSARPERFVIDRVLRRNVRINGILHHFVSWRGYPDSFNSYEPVTNSINIRGTRP